MKKSVGNEMITLSTWGCIGVEDKSYGEIIIQSIIMQHYSFFLKYDEIQQYHNNAYIYIICFQYISPLCTKLSNVYMIFDNSMHNKINNVVRPYNLEANVWLDQKY